MPDAPKTFSEDQVQGMIAATVARETADLKTENDGLNRDLEVAQAQTAAAQQETAEVQAAFEAYKAEQETQAEQDKLAQVRTAAYKEAAPHMAESFYTPERAARWASMSQEIFDEVLESVKSLGGTRRQTAMAGTEVPGGKSEGTAARSFLAGKAV